MRYIILLLLLYVTSTSSFSFLADGTAYQTCILNNGKVTCQGKNYKGILGIGETSETVVHNRPQTVVASGATDLACTALYIACVIIENGNLKSWGEGTEYVTGLGTTTTKYEPTLIGSGYDAVQCGFNFCAAKKTDGKLYAWGRNSYKIFGSNTNTLKTTPNKPGPFLEHFEIP